MHWRGGPRPEITRVFDQWLAEMVHPAAVHDHPAGEWVARRSDGPRQVEPAAAMRERPPCAPRRDRDELSRHVFALLGRIAADEDARLTRLFRVAEHHRP